MAGPPPNASRFRTDDGFTLSATWYEPSSRPAPAVILVHMLHGSRRDWDAFGHRLAGEGIGALAIDLRGHGDSQRVAAPGPEAEGGGYAPMALDVKAARRYLASRNDVQQTRVGIAGASLGANLAALAAVGDGSLVSIALAVAVPRLPRLAHRAGGEENRRPPGPAGGRDQRSVRVTVRTRAAEGCWRTPGAAHSRERGTRHRHAVARRKPRACAGGLVSPNVVMIVVRAQRIGAFRGRRRVLRPPGRLDYRQPAGRSRAADATRSRSPVGPVAGGSAAAA